MSLKQSGKVTNIPDKLQELLLTVWLGMFNKKSGKITAFSMC
jgi:hypothetical protein